MIEWLGLLRVDNNNFVWMGHTLLLSIDTVNIGVQKDMTVGTPSVPPSVTRRQTVTKSLKVHFHKNRHHRDLRRRGPDCHLPEPNRGLHPINHQSETKL